MKILSYVEMVVRLLKTHSVIAVGSFSALLVASAGRTALSEAVSPLEGGRRGVGRTGLPRRAVFKQLKRGLGIPSDKQEI